MNGFSKTLEIQGVGYRAMKKGSGIELHVGFSHTIEYTAPDGVSLDLPDQTTIVVTGVDKQKVGQAAAEIRASGHPSRIRARGFGTRANMYGVRLARPQQHRGRTMSHKKSVTTREGQRKRRHARVRKKIWGTAGRPRLVVFRSLKNSRVRSSMTTRGGPWWVFPRFAPSSPTSRPRVRT